MEKVESREKWQKLNVNNCRLKLNQSVCIWGKSLLAQGRKWATFVIPESKQLTGIFALLTTTLSKDFVEKVYTSGFLVLGYLPCSEQMYGGWVKFKLTRL